jgi:hypothetical protein
MRYKQSLPVFLSFLVAAFFVVSRPVLAIDKGGSTSVNNAEEMVCYPDALSDEDRELRVQIPCAPANYIRIPVKLIESEKLYNKDDFWTQEEKTGSKIVKSTIWEGKEKIGDVDVTVSVIIGYMCETLHTCPMKIRITSPDGKIVIHEITGKYGEQPLSATQYIFVRKDLKELLVRDRHYSIN